MGDVGGIAGGYFSYEAGKEAAEAMEKAAQIASATQLKMFKQARADLAPWRESGEWALSELKTLIGAGPGEFVPEEDPGYRFGYEEFVEKPTLRGAAAGGSLQSGQTAKALTQYAQDYASTKVDNFLARYYKKLNPYQSMAGLGQTSAAQTAGLTVGTGQSLSQNYLNQMISAQNARLAGASGLASGLSQFGSGAWDYYRPKYGGGGYNYLNTGGKTYTAWNPSMNQGWGR